MSLKLLPARKIHRHCLAISCGIDYDIGENRKVWLRLISVNDKRIRPSEAGRDPDELF